MDAADFPSLAYHGTCQSSGLQGMLGLHGVTRPFALSLTWTPRRIVAKGDLHRADWGMTALPILGGQTVRILVSVPLTGQQASRD